MAILSITAQPASADTDIGAKIGDGMLTTLGACSFGYAAGGAASMLIAGPTSKTVLPMAITGCALVGVGYMAYKDANAAPSTEDLQEDTAVEMNADPDPEPESE